MQELYHSAGESSGTSLLFDGKNFRGKSSIRHNSVSCNHQFISITYYYFPYIRPWFPVKKKFNFVQRQVVGGAPFLGGSDRYGDWLRDLASFGSTQVGCAWICCKKYREINRSIFVDQFGGLKDR